MTDSHQKRTQPESFRARDLSASLTVKDLEKSLAWYTGVMGFTVDRRHEREGNLIAISLKAGAVRLLITTDNWRKRARPHERRRIFLAAHYCAEHRRARCSGSKSEVGRSRPSRPTRSDSAFSVSSTPMDSSS